MAVSHYRDVCLIFPPVWFVMVYSVLWGPPPPLFLCWSLLNFDPEPPVFLGMKLSFFWEVEIGGLGDKITDAGVHLDYYVFFPPVLKGIILDSETFQAKDA